MMNQIVSESPNSDGAPSLGRNQPHVDDLRTPRTIRARPAAEIAAPIRSRCGRAPTGSSAARRARKRMAMTMMTSPAKT